MTKLSSKTQFRLGSGLILFIFCLAVALVVYRIGKEEAEKRVFKETEIYIAAVDATRTYVKDVLRPRMYEIIPADHFVVEAMSTSFVGREVMHRVHDRFKDFRYKRAALVPINPASKADALEADFIQRFNADPNLREWSGLVERDGRNYYARLRAIYAEAECLRCHGDPGDIPQAIVELYGNDVTRKAYRLDQVVGADIVYIPVDVVFSRIKRLAWVAFIIGAGCLFCLVVLFYALFNHTVISELQGLLTTFREIASPSKELEALETPSAHGGDEFDQVKSAFQDAAADLKLAHDELTASETKYRQLFEASRDPILIWDAAGRILDINAAGLHLLGFEDRYDAKQNGRARDLFQASEDGRRLLQTVDRDGFVKEFEIVLVSRQGGGIDALLTVNRTADDNETPRYEVYIRDITLRKRMEKQMARTEKMASIGQLAAGVAHEINNPLSVISCYSNLIEKSGDATDQIREDLEKVKKHTLNCKRIVDSLLNFARVSETHRRAADVHAGLESVLTIIEKQVGKRQVEIRRCYAPSLPLVSIDEDKMVQVYMNILLNAVQAIDDQGTVTISTAYDPQSDRVHLAFADTGTGIAPADLDKIFDPFYTTKKNEEGTGLGLSVSYGIVHEHEGDIQVESHPGRGSVFTIALPTSVVGDPGGVP
jgi:two-component system, NtrC family, sensor kinase